MVLYMSSQREIQKQNKISCKTAKNAGVAQLVEQLICNQQVGGSSPSTSSKLPLQRTGEYGGIPEWPKGADCKSVVSDFGGSNPPSPTKKIVTPYGVTIFLFERRADPPSPPKPPAVFRIHPFPPNSIPKSISITS